MSRSTGTELKRGQDVVALQVRIFGEDVVDRHVRRQPFEHALDCEAQPSERRLTVTDGRVGRDAIEPGHRVTIPPPQAMFAGSSKACWATLRATEGDLVREGCRVTR